jgi:hypothetical protein
MLRKKGLLTTVLVGGAVLTMALAASGQAIISNGVIKLGINAEGHLNLDGGIPSAGTGTSTVGLRFIRPFGELEYTAPGCFCEGFGVADGDGSLTGYANRATDGVVNLAAGATVTDGVMAVTTATATTGTKSLMVEHDYHPSAHPNLYEALVTITNVGTDPITDLLYVRVMDWDVEPTAFSEFVSIGGLPASAVRRSHDNGFNTANPIGGDASIDPATEDVNFSDNGPADHGAYFRFGFGALGVGEEKTFSIFYGATESEAAALAALAAVGAEVFSFGKPNIGGDGGDPDLDTGDPGYSVAIFAFKGVGGTPVGVIPEPGTLAMLAGMGVTGLAFFLRRRMR